STATSSTLARPAPGCSTRRNEDEDIIGVVQAGRCRSHGREGNADGGTRDQRGGARSHRRRWRENGGKDKPNRRLTSRAEDGRRLPGALQLFFPASPSGSTTCCSTTLRRPGSVPDRSSRAMLWASWTVNRPDIWPEPPRIGSRMIGAESTSLSSTMANGRPTLSWVSWAKRRVPLALNRKLTI